MTEKKATSLGFIIFLSVYILVPAALIILWYLSLQDYVTDSIEWINLLVAWGLIMVFYRLFTVQNRMKQQIEAEM